MTSKLYLACHFLTLVRGFTLESGLMLLAAAFAAFNYSALRLAPTGSPGKTPALNAARRPR
jgi:hypothetical protein